MSEYTTYALSMVVVLAIGLAGYAFTRKSQARKIAAASEGAMLRTLVDNLRNKLGSGVVVLGSAQEDGKVALIAGVTRDLTGRLSAGKIIAPLAQKVGGSGGGRPDMAEAGGKDASALSAALASTPDVVRDLLGKTALSV